MRKSLVVILLLFGPCIFCTAQRDVSNMHSVSRLVAQNKQIAYTLTVHPLTDESFRLEKPALPFPDPDHYTLRKPYSPQVERRANRLLLSSGICIVTGAALLTAAFLLEKNDRSGVYLLPLALGGASLQAGVGLAIPGAILKQRNHARLRAIE